jgi:hypothetical protein
MKKLKLNLDSLRVDSFETAAPSVARGTVQGHDATRLADSCSCPYPTDGCSLYCGGSSGQCSGDCDGDTVVDPHSNNCWTIIEY